MISALLIWMPLTGLTQFKFFYGALGIMFITGLRDDLVPIKPIFKLAAQLLASFMIIFLMDIRLGSLYGLLGIGDLPYIISIGLTLFVIIVITNSYNLIDGLDGLAGSLGSVAFFFFGIYFFLVGELYFAMVSMACLGGIIAFLNFNWEPSRIFMGDTGALFLGFVLSVMVIHFIDFNHNLPDDYRFKLVPSVGTAVCVIIMPLFDTLRVFISRALRGQSPFSPDKTHIHHMIMRFGVNHSNTTLIMVGVNLLFIVLALSMRKLNDHYLVVALIALCMAISLLLDFMLKRYVSTRRLAVKKFKSKGK
jgi:UDP-GlcNAc:undecaprenyl-phosphate/decaprenyl-phosphate GlcNAc-1-phosphate transferase